MPSESIEEWIHVALEQRLGFAQRIAGNSDGRGEKGRQADFRATRFPDRAVGSAERDALDAWWPFGDELDGGARLDFNLFAGGAQKARVAESNRRTANKAKHNVEWFRSGGADGSAQAYLDGNDRSPQRAPRAARVCSWKQAKESLRIVQNRYEAGPDDC